MGTLVVRSNIDARDVDGALVAEYEAFLPISILQ